MKKKEFVKMENIYTGFKTRQPFGCINPTKAEIVVSLPRPSCRYSVHTMS